MSDAVAADPQETDQAPPAEPTGADPQPAPEQAQDESTPLAGDQPTEQPDLPKWHYQLPGDLQGHDRLRDHSSIGELAKAFLEQREANESKIDLPGEDSDDEAKAEFYNKLGRPETPEGYEFEKPENSENLGINDDTLSEYAKKAHELGLSKVQAETLHQWQTERIKNVVESQTQSLEQEKQQGIEELQKEYGDQFQAKIQNAQEAFAKFGGENLLAYLKSTGQDDSPELIRAFAAIYEATAEDSLEAGTIDPFGNPPEKSDWYPSMPK